MEVMITKQKTSYIVPQQVLDESQAFLRARGLEGCEGMALWIGKAATEAGMISITRVFVPEQICIKSEFGVAVDMTPHAHYTLTDALMPSERFYARIHSHPKKAFHSVRDDENAVLTHEGAISVVVPDFAKEPVRLARCAVFRLVHGKGWMPLSKASVREMFQVMP